MKKNNKGFTLAELLIVVAIIAVLTAIAIPVFSSQLEKSKEATDQANVRSAYAQVVTEYLTDGKPHSMTVSAQQQQTGWQNSDNGHVMIQVSGKESQVSFGAKIKGNNYSINIDESASITIN